MDKNKHNHYEGNTKNKRGKNYNKSYDNTVYSGDNAPHNMMKGLSNPKNDTTPKPLPRTRVNQESHKASADTIQFEDGNHRSKFQESSISMEQNSDSTQSWNKREKNKASADTIQFEDGNHRSKFQERYISMGQNSDSTQSWNKREKNKASADTIQFEDGNLRSKFQESSISMEQNFDSTQSWTKREKNYTKKYTNELPYLCTTCETCIHKDLCSQHKNNLHHEILPLAQGIANLEVKKNDKLQVIEHKVNGILEAEHNIGRALSSWLNLMIDPLLEVFGVLQESTAKDTDDLVMLLDDVQKTKSTKRSANFIEYLAFKTSAEKIGLRGETLILENQQKPFWLISSWFKVSMGMMLQSGKKCVSFLNHRSTFAPLTLQGDRILISCFRQDSRFVPDEGTIFLPHDFMKCIFDKEDSSAFMRVSYAGKDEGFVFVRIDKECFWGRQFTEMCSGTTGCSYMHTRFFRNCLKGKAGHQMWGGDYSNGDGSGGEQVVGDKNEPLNANPKPIMRGMLAARYGFNDHSTIFRVYIAGKEAMSTSIFGSDTDATDNGAFGHVEEGLHILSHVANMPDITKVVIADVGRILKVA